MTRFSIVARSSGVREMFMVVAAITEDNIRLPTNLVNLWQACQKSGRSGLTSLRWNASGAARSNVGLVQLLVGLTEGLVDLGELLSQPPAFILEGERLEAQVINILLDLPA